MRPNVTQFPAGFIARDYQLPILQAIDNGTKRAALCWHRRAGKEMTCWQALIKQALLRVGTYWYTFPTYRLGRDIIWEGANKDGKRFLDYIPPELIVGKPDKQRMSIRLTNGSQIQVLGTDGSIQVGTNPLGVVFSEYSLQNPDAWNFTRPILRENGGWAIFNFTPRGHNHAHELWQMAQGNDDWYSSMLTIDDTGVLQESDLDDDRREGMSEEMIAQEYYCSFDRGADGCYYLRYITTARNEGRIGYSPMEPYAMVDTYWDLGVADATAIIFAQTIGNEIRIIDYYERSDEDIGHFATMLEDKRQEHGYRYGKHWAPHDIKQRQQFAQLRTRLDIAKDVGIDFEVVPNYPILEGIELGRGMFPRVFIDEKKCHRLIRALEMYHRHYNKTENIYTNKPCHDWTSHAADAYRYLAIVQYLCQQNTMTAESAKALAQRHRRII